MSATESTENVEPGMLQRLARLMYKAHEQISLSGIALFEKKTIEAHEHRITAQNAARNALSVLSELGVRATPLPPPAPIGLDQLDTPDTRELLALLESAQAVAERVDAARGRSLPGIALTPGESRGTDLAESISYLALRVRSEVCGPLGRD
ncbi:MAG: hypothetical protein V4671_09675 [Armatimonadota bacterium]